MSDSFANGANARSISLKGSPITKVKPKRPRVLVVGPASVSVEEIGALKYAFEEAGARVSTFRTDDMFTFSELQAEIRREADPFTHLLLALDGEAGYDLKILSEAERAKVPWIGIVCVFTDQSLGRCAQHIQRGGVHLIAVKSHAEHARIREKAGAIPTMVFQHLMSSASDIVQTSLAI